MRTVAAKANKIRVLIAEDHLVARVGLAAIINMQPDMKVVAEAVNGQQAVELYQQHKPDITLLDMRMPKMTGDESARAICAHDPNARLIALTTYGGDEDVRRALDAGVKAYLTKDVLHDELLKAIRAVHSGLTYLPDAWSYGLTLTGDLATVTIADPGTNTPSSVITVTLPTAGSLSVP